MAVVVPTSCSLTAKRIYENSTPNCAAGKAYSSDYLYAEDTYEASKVEIGADIHSRKIA